MGTIGLFSDDSSDSEVEVQTKIIEKRIVERKVIKTVKHRNIIRHHTVPIIKHSKHSKNKNFLNYSNTLPVNPIIKEIRKTQYVNGWRRLSNNIEKESWV